MNKVVKAENEKSTAIDYSTAAETVSDEVKRGKIKEAEEIKQSKTINTEREDGAIRLVNEAADKYFIGNAQLLRKLETVKIMLKCTVKKIISALIELLNVIAVLAGMLPLNKKEYLSKLSNGVLREFLYKCKTKL